VDADGTALAIGRFSHAGEGLRTINEMAKVKAAGAGNFFARSVDTVLRMDAGREQDGSEHSKDCAWQVHVCWTRSREIKYRLYHRPIHSQPLADATALLAGDDDLLYLSCFTCRCRHVDTGWIRPRPDEPKPKRNARQCSPHQVGSTTVDSDIDPLV
jgi:hypothetical protein